MNDLAELEHGLTRALRARLANASPPDDAWERIVAALSDHPTGVVAVTEQAPDLLASLDDVVESAVDSAEGMTEERRGDGLMVDYLHQRPYESDTPAGQKGWRGVVIAVAATILVVVGVVVVADGDSGDVVTDPASSPAEAVPVPLPSVADPVPSPEVDDPAAWPSVIDPVSSYQWVRLPLDEVAFGAVAAEAGPEGPLAVTTGGPGLVAVGSTGSLYNEDAAVWTSVDGLTWARVPHDESVFGLGAAAQTLMTSVVDTGSILVAVGHHNRCCGPNLTAAVWTSVDGTTWTRVPDDPVFEGVTGMTSVTTGGPGLVAVGNQWKSDEDSVGVIWTSVDGHTWTRVPLDQALFDPSEMAGVISGGPGLVAVGSDDLGAAIWTSVDGHTWSRVPYEESVFGDAGMDDVTTGGPGLVAVGSDDLGAAVWTSEDGITWSRVPHDQPVFDNAGMRNVTTGGPGLVAIGSDWRSDEDAVAVVWTSVDGRTWSRVPHNEAIFGGGSHMSSVVAVGPGLVAVGLADPDDGVVWVATPTN